MSRTKVDSTQRVDTPPPRAARNRLVGVLLIITSLAAALVCSLVFTTWLPGDQARYREYQAADACPGRAVVPRSEDCLRKVDFTVESTDDRIKHLSATLLGPEPFPRMHVSFGDPGPVLSELQHGKKVTGTMWRGDVVAIARGDVGQASSDAPRDEIQAPAAAGTCAGLLAALALMFGVVRLTRPRDPGFFTWRPYGKWLVMVTGGSCALVGLVSVWAGFPWPTVPAVCGAVVAVTAFFLHRDLRLGRVGQGAGRTPRSVSPRS
ncbi:hypothetical protein OIU91_00250 [Streptomyces sp. NBC_01456]|uniref:hypothetical protein n=1 Tax=unclassified Streptomyces TaxID=2593676 RepID=UPI002E3154F4|nr:MULTISPECIES: hypothetical protein [unclassified Streptomyces]